MTIVAIEGIDGAGNDTQARLLTLKLQNLGLMAATLSFPRYSDTTAGKTAVQYLHGVFGGSVHPKLAAMLYAVDRYESRWLLRSMIADNDVVVLDRYVGSNMAHQSVRVAWNENRRDFVDWIVNLEFEIFKMPVPDVTVLIDMPVRRISELVEKKEARAYTNKKADAHESNHDYLKLVRQQYRDLAERCEWIVVDGTHANGSLKSPDEVSAEILTSVLKAMGQQYRLYPNVTFDGDAVAKAIHASWCAKSWDDASENDREDSIVSADALIAEVVRQLSLKVR